LTYHDGVAIVDEVLEDGRGVKTARVGAVGRAHERVSRRPQYSGIGEEGGRIGNPQTNTAFRHDARVFGENVKDVRLEVQLEMEMSKSRERRSVESF
jgi:hypothetical protein